MPDETARMKWFMVIATTTGVFGIVVMLAYQTLDSMIVGALLPIVGIIVGKWGTIVDFLFGSSSGSMKKTDLLNEMTGTGDGKSTTTATVKTDITKTVTTEPPKEGATP